MADIAVWLSPILSSRYHALEQTRCWSCMLVKSPSIVLGVSTRHVNCGIRAEHVTSGREAMEFLRLYDYDVVLLDLDLPDVRGQELIRRIRAAHITVAHTGLRR